MPGTFSRRSAVSAYSLFATRLTLMQRDTRLASPVRKRRRAARSRASLVDVAPGRNGEGGATLLGGVGTSAAPMNGYPRVFNIEADPHEDTTSAKCTNGWPGRC
jgi:hypothetical protein